VAAGRDGTLRPSADARHRIRVRVAAQGNGGWHLINDGVSILRPETRMIGLCVFSPSGLRFRLGEDVVEKLGVPPPSHVWLTFSDTP